jgi:hypothetical protein
MAYTFSVNNIPLTGSVAMYTLISTLISAGWTKVMDSDGTTYSSSGAQLNHGGAGVNGLGNTSAWVRLRAPAVNVGTVVNQTRELTFQRGTTDVVWRIKYSASAGFSGGSPSSTATPSAADEVFMAGSGTDASPGYTTIFTTNKTYHWNVAAGGASEFYSFVAFAHPIGSVTTAASLIVLDALTLGSYSSLDVDPAVTICTTNSWSSSDFIGTSAAITNVTNPSYARAWMGPTTAAGASITSNSVNVNIVVYGNNIIGGTSTNQGTNPWTNKDDLVPALWVSQNSIAPRGIKGFSSVFSLGTTSRRNMETIDVFSIRDKIYVHGLWLPWSGVTPMI